MKWLLLGCGFCANFQGDGTAGRALRPSPRTKARGSPSAPWPRCGEDSAQHCGRSERARLPEIGGCRVKSRRTAPPPPRPASLRRRRSSRVPAARTPTRGGGGRPAPGASPDRGKRQFQAPARRRAPGPGLLPLGTRGHHGDSRCPCPALRGAPRAAGVCRALIPHI